jgi:phosphoribosylformimino-5-aminoimidazole carboxamide ribotide isomerase
MERPFVDPMNWKKTSTNIRKRTERDKSSSLEIEPYFVHFHDMLLVIPAIEVKGGHSVQMVQGVEGFTYSDDPIEMARLCRLENAKSIHVTDIDGALQGHLVNIETIRDMVAKVDIPLELGGGLRTFEEVQKAFNLGVYRVLLSTMMVENPDEAKRVLDEYGPSKVVLGIDAYDGIAATRGWTASSGLTAMTVALNAKELGFRRIVYTDIRLDGTLRGVNISMLRDLGEKTGVRITAAGGISGLMDLLSVQELAPFGVDSVIIGRALYQNKFSCQRLWRMCEARQYPYTAKV